MSHFSNILVSVEHTIIYNSNTEFRFAENASVLKYLTLPSPSFLPRDDDGSSATIHIPNGFPFGSQVFYSTYVS